MKLGVILSRLQAQKYKLSKLLKNYDENLTEIENMSNNGFVCIFDSGNIKVSYGM